MTIHNHVLAAVQVFETFIPDIDNQQILKDVEKNNKRLSDDNNESFFEDYKYIETPYLIKLKDIIREKSESIMNCKLKYDSIWVHKTEPKGSTALHSHLGSFCSFVFYTNFLERQGNLKFILFWNGRILEKEIEPKKNMLLIFPSDVFHHTGKNATNKDRVSISGNFSII
jgi:hypothetical protein